MKLQFELHVSIEPAAASLQRFNWSGPPSGTRNFLKEHMVHVPGHTHTQHVRVCVRLWVLYLSIYMY